MLEKIKNTKTQVHILKIKMRISVFLLFLLFICVLILQTLVKTRYFVSY